MLKFGGIALVLTLLAVHTAAWSPLHVPSIRLGGAQLRKTTVCAQQQGAVEKVPGLNVDRRGFASLFVGALALIGKPVQTNAANTKSSTELQKEVAQLEKEVESTFKVATSSADSAVKSFGSALQNGNMTAASFQGFVKAANELDKASTDLQAESAAVIGKLEADEELLGTQAVEKYDAASDAGKKGADKGSKLLAEGQALKQKAASKAQAQKDWNKIVGDFNKNTAEFKALAGSENAKAVTMLQNSIKNASEAMEMFQRGVKQMGNVELFNEKGEMKNASVPLKVVKDACIKMKFAQETATKAASELKKVSAKGQSSKVSALPLTDKMLNILKEVGKESKGAEKIVKTSQGTLALASSKIADAEKKSESFAAGLKSVLSLMNEAETKFATAEKSGIKSDQTYALAQAQTLKEQEEIAKYRKKRKETTTKIAPTTSEAPAAPDTLKPSVAPAASSLSVNATSRASPKPSTSTPAASIASPPAPKPSTLPSAAPSSSPSSGPAPPLPKKSTLAPPPTKSEEDDDDEDDSPAPKPATPKPTSSLPSSATPAPKAPASPPLKKQDDSSVDWQALLNEK